MEPTGNDCSKNSRGSGRQHRTGHCVSGRTSKRLDRQIEISDVVRDYGETIERYLMRWLGREEAEEVAQEVFIKAWENASSYSAERGPVIAWLLVIARSRALVRASACPEGPPSRAWELWHAGEPVVTRADQQRHGRGVAVATLTMALLFALTAAAFFGAGRSPGAPGAR